MNHIYKVIWNHAKHCYAVVSEIAKNHSTSSVTKKKVSIAAILAAGMLSGFSPMVSGAADTTNSEAVVYDQNETSLKSTNSNGVGKNAIALGKGASAVDNSIAIGNGAYTQDGNREKGQSVALGNGAVTGAKSTSIGSKAIGGREGTITIGANAKNEALYSTVVGTDSKITSDGKAYTATLPFVGKKSVIVQGAVSTSYGAHNTITNEKKVFSGVANSISGSANTVTNSNGVTIQGTGNTVSNAYKDMKFEIGDLLDFKNGDYSSIAKQDSGAIAIIGGANTISNQTSSTVIGFGNTLEGENSTGVLTAGSQNTLTNVSNSLVMGDKNTLVNRKNVISLGNENTVTADDAVAIGNGTTVSVESGVAIGVGSVADRVAESEKGARGEFAPDTIPTGQESTWTSTKGAVSVGDTANNITRQITNVAAGREDTDAVNVAQLKKVNEEAGKHSVVTEGANITVTPEQAEDGRMQYNVALNNNIRLSGDNDAFVNISGSNGSVWASSSVAAGNVIMDGTTATVSGLGNTTTAYDGFANGEGKAATEEQLKEVSKVAENANQGWNLSTNGGEASKVAPGETVDISGDKNIKISNDGTNVKVKLNDNIDVNSVQTNALNAKYNLSVGTANENGTVPFFVNSNGAFYAANGKLVVDKDGKVTATEGEIGNVVLKNGVLYKNTALRDGELYVGDADGNYSQITSKNAKLGKVMIDDTGRISGVAAGRIAANSTDAINGSQLHAVQQEAGKHTKVVNGSNITVEETDQDGQKTYKVGLNKDLLLGDITGKNVSISGTNGTIETTGFIATKDKIYADKGAKLADVNVTGDTISNDKSSVKLDKDGTVTINKSVTIDQSGKISGVAVNVNSVQTNALNSKYNLSVGTAAADGKMPFFVNSNGAFYAAGGEFVVDKDGSVKATSGDIGNVKLNDGVFYKNSALRDGELYVGDADGNYSQITSKNAKLGKVMIDDTGRISGVAAGRIAANSTDAINGSQLHAVQQEAGKHTKVVNGSNITVEETDQDGQKTYKVGLNKDLLLGDITGKNVSISGTNGTIETTGFIATKDKIYADKGAKLADVNVTGDTISNDKSSVKLDKEGTVTINNRVTIDQSGKISGVAAGEISSTSTDAVNGSQLKATNDRVSQVEGNITEIKGDITNIKSDITNIKGDVKNLGDRVTKVEQEAGKHTKVVNGSNVTVEETDQDGQKTYKVGLNKDLLLGDITGKNVSISGTNGTIETTGSIATKDKIYAEKGAKLADIDITGDTISNDKSSVKLDKNGTVTINNKVTVDQDGKVSGVAAGDISEKSTDAVNGSQLFATNQQVSKLGNRINKVGAGAAALAALHPLDFDPDDKWDIAAGYGNYNGENAAAIGAYYRPNEDTMFSVGGSFGNGENMVNAGVSLKLGQGNHVSTSKVAMAKEIKDLRKELEGLKSALLDVNAGKKLDTSKLQLFPDVPKNHWAYEYVSTLKGNGALTGYPDGEFKGDRPMTRYEFATMLYKAMLEGATLSDKILKEFAPELERFTVDTVHQDKDGKPTVERVRTVKAEK